MLAEMKKIHLIVTSLTVLEHSILSFCRFESRLKCLYYQIIIKSFLRVSKHQNNFNQVDIHAKSHIPSFISLFSFFSSLSPPFSSSPFSPLLPHLWWPNVPQLERQLPSDRPCKILNNVERGPIAFRHFQHFSTFSANLHPCSSLFSTFDQSEARNIERKLLLRDVFTFARSICLAILLAAGVYLFFSKMVSMHTFLTVSDDRTLC